MNEPEIHVGDIGTALKFTVRDRITDAVVDISSATTRKVVFRKPDGSASEKDVTLINGGTTGMCRYTSASGEWDQVGQWDAQLRLVISGWTGRSSRVSFRVYEALPTS